MCVCVCMYVFMCVCVCVCMYVCVYVCLPARKVDIFKQVSITTHASAGVPPYSLSVPADRNLSPNLSAVSVGLMNSLPSRT